MPLPKRQLPPTGGVLVVGVGVGVRVVAGVDDEGEPPPQDRFRIAREATAAAASAATGRVRRLSIISTSSLRAQGRRPVEPTVRKGIVPREMPEDKRFRASSRHLTADGKR
jgi:hypothetical protein